MASEQHRISFLIQRDGYEQARQWVDNTLTLYRDAAASAASHASYTDYQSEFHQAIDEFQAWLKTSSPERPMGQFVGNQR